jgi:hypothetical protein
MTDENELRELRERIERLPFNDRLRLFESVFVEYQRRWDEEVAAQQAAVAAFLEREKLQNARNASAPVPPETKREAG